MVYVDCGKASQIRMEVNVNFIWDFLGKHYYNYQHLKVRRIAERVEDELNAMEYLEVDIIRLHLILRKIIGLAFKCELT